MKSEQNNNKQMREHYKFFFPITTRWMDNDIYGHVNNVVYYSYFDSIVNQFLIEHAQLDIHTGKHIGLMVASNCEYHASISFPDKIVGGFCVDHLGNSSVRYGVAIFKDNEEKACATGSLTHVFVQRDTNRSISIPQETRAALSTALTETLR
ncbi:acyl-CoA thioesterase [Ningiella sp. W23]|uniref:acyl-CoA thioesterase n=1 Tax=Ningiella sp. W23 TaxID=3023715 RepID=UPI00375814C7